MKNEDESLNQIGLEETNSVFQIWKELKNSIFNVLFVLLNQSDDGEDESIIGLAIETGIDYLQMMSFPFHDAIIDVWNGGETLANFTSIFTNLSVSKFIPGVSFGTFLAMLYLLIFVIILVILDIIYVSYSFSKKKFKYTWPLVFLAKVVPLCVTVFFLPIMETLLSVVSCENSEEIDGVQVMESFPDVNCWEGWHMFHAVVTLFFTSIFVFISSIVALTIFEPRMTTNRLTARQNSEGEVIFIINKMVCQFVFSFTPFENTWIYIIMLFGLSGWLWNSYNVEQPFYNKNASKFFRICSSYYFWTNFMLLVSQFLVGFGFQGGLVIWMCGLPFIGLCIVFERKSNIDKLFSSNLKFRSGEELEAHLQYVLQLIHNRKKDKNSYMLLLGYIEKHIEVCLEEDCPLKIKHLKKEENLTEIEENCKQLIKQLLRMFKQGVKKYPQCTRLRLGFAFFYMEMIDNTQRAYEEFSIASSTEPSFGEQFIIYRFKKIIRENLENQENEEESDLIEIIRFDNHVSLCEEAMLMSARLHKDFWTELEEETPDLKKLNLIGSKITQTTVMVKQNYKEVQRINNHVPEIIHNYSLYLIFIEQNQSEGRKTLQESKRIYLEKKETEENDMSIFLLPNHEYADLANIDTCFNSMIKVNIEGDHTLGRIVYCNDAFTELSGYLREEITERPLDKIMPLAYRSYHTQCVNSWIMDPEKSTLSLNNQYLSQPHKGYISHKSGFILPVDYRVSFDIEENCFRTFLRVDPSAYNDFNCKVYITTNVHKVIKDISILGYALFKISGDDCLNCEYYLDEIGIPLSSLNQQQLYNYIGVDIALKKAKGQRTNPSLKTQTAYDHKNVPTVKSFSRKSDTGNDNVDNDEERLQSAFNQNQNETEVFNIKAEDIWIKATNLISTDDTDQTFEEKDGKIKIGTTYTLERVKGGPIQIQNNETPNDQLNCLDFLLNDYYQEDPVYAFADEADPFEREKKKKSKILADMLIEMNNGQALTFEEKKFRNYGEELRIKTYRYFDKDFKRIYGIEYENDQDNDFMYENDGLCSIEDIKKLEREHYQTKIKEAINTNIQHQEISFLRGYSFVFLVILCAFSAWSFSISVEELSKVEYFANANYNRCQDSAFLTSMLQETLQGGAGPYSAELQTEVSNYQLSFDPDISQLCELEDGKVAQKTIKEIMAMVQATIVNYMSSDSVNKNINKAYRNFIFSVMETLEKFAYYPTLDTDTTLVFSVVLGVNSTLMILLWAYNILKIDQKRFDIMIWFLDIPIDYVMYLQHNCNRFIKNYVEIKELEARGLNMDDKEHYCDQYNGKKGSQEGGGNDGDDEEIDEENKARKILIARHRKKTFLSRFTCGYLQSLWLLLAGMAVSVAMNIEISYESNKFEFVLKEWQLINQQFIWSSVLPIGLALESQGTVTLQNSFGSVNLTEFSSKLKRNFLNTYTRLQQVSQLKELLEQEEDISSILSSVYFGDLCTVIAPADEGVASESQLRCQSLLQAKLRGGFATYSSYLVNLGLSELESMTEAQYEFVGPSMMLIFEQWRNTFIEEAQSMMTVNTLLICFYVLTALIAYFSVWLMYLNKQNKKMNQTIQMLNMIPITMMPKERKDTRDFFFWLVAQASQQKAES